MSLFVLIAITVLQTRGCFSPFFIQSIIVVKIKVMIYQLDKSRGFAKLLNLIGRTALYALQ